MQITVYYVVAPPHSGRVLLIKVACFCAAAAAEEPFADRLEGCQHHHGWLVSRRRRRRVKARRSLTAHKM